MPAHRIGLGPYSIRKFDVIGQDSEAMPEFTRHVVLAGEDRSSHVASQTLPWVHMGPPLERAESRGPIHCFGTAALTADELLRMNVYIDEVEGEYESHKIRSSRSQYVIHPHVEPVAAPDGTVIYHKFSCAGFVIEAYREAPIDLLTTEDTDLPRVDLETLVRQYPDQEVPLRSPRMREKLGLTGDGPWGVVLAGYVLNSLARTEETIRSQAHQPVIGDAYFPPRP